MFAAVIEGEPSQPVGNTAQQRQSESSRQTGRKRKKLPQTGRERRKKNVRQMQQRSQQGTLIEKGERRKSLNKPHWCLPY